jgi:hypothetical protein
MPINADFLQNRPKKNGTKAQVFQKRFFLSSIFPIAAACLVASRFTNTANKKGRYLPAFLFAL